MSIGENIKHLRESRNMTQGDFAFELGVTQPFIVAIEKGRKSPSLQMAIDIAAYFGCTVEQLIHGDFPACITE